MTGHWPELRLCGKALSDFSAGEGWPMLQVLGLASGQVAPLTGFTSE